MVKVEFKFGAFACKPSQPAQGHLEVACAQLLLIVVIAELALFPYLDGSAVACRGAAHPYAFGVVSTVSEGRGAAGAYPFATACMAFFLLFQSLPEQFHQLVPAVFLDGGLFFGRKMLLELFDQPVQGYFLVVGHGSFQLTVELAKCLVVAVEQRFVFYQCHARQMVEVVDAGCHHPSLQGTEQCQVFLHGNRQFAGTQVIEEIKQHGAVPADKADGPELPAIHRVSGCT